MKLPEAIEHVQQPTADTCVSACIAMVTGEPVDSVVNKFHHAFLNGDITVEDYFTDHHPEINYCMGSQFAQDLHYDKVYFLVVPSLNIQGHFHQIVVDTRVPGITVLDPAQGRENKRYYVWDTADDIEQFTIQGDRLAVNLSDSSWFIDYVIEDEQ